MLQRFWMWYPGWVSSRTLIRNPNAARTFSPSLVSLPLSIELISSHSRSMAPSPTPGLTVTLKAPMPSHYCLDTQKFLGLPASAAFQKFLNLDRRSPLNRSTVTPALVHLVLIITTWMDGCKGWFLERGCQVEDPTAVHYSCPKRCIPDSSHSSHVNITTCLRFTFQVEP